jgi:hypothetical protein
MKEFAYFETMSYKKNGNGGQKDTRQGTFTAVVSGPPPSLLQKADSYGTTN